MAGYKLWQRRESRNMKLVAKNQKTNMLEGPKQMKIVVKKEDLKQLLEAIRDGRIRGGPPSTAAATSLEQRLNLLRRRQILRAAAGQAKARTRSRSGSWRPVLQSIPEEL